MKTFRDVIDKNRAWYCLDCGKCSSVCPVTLHLVDDYTSPRLLVETALTGGEQTTLDDPLLWSCLTCQRCSRVCPSEVDFSALIRDARQLAGQQGLSGTCTHGDVVQTWMQMMTNPELEQNRLGWIRGDLEVSNDSDTIYFSGCLPYYDTAFRDLGIEGLDIACSAVQILNSLGIAPQVLENERCCGHDLYWQGEEEAFKELAVLNLEEFSRSGASQIVTTCPECAFTLKETYREAVGDMGLEVYHLTEFLAQRGIFPGKGNADLPGATVTYQDPCRLGRYTGIYREPRDLLEGSGYQLVEMDHNREESICCGTSCWTNCGKVNQLTQVERLREARSTQAEILVTACPKCQIHLKCAQKNPENGGESVLPIRDITTLIAERIQSPKRMDKGGNL